MSGTLMLEPAWGMVVVLSFRGVVRRADYARRRPRPLLELSLRALDGEVERQRGGVLDLLHGEAEDTLRSRCGR